MDVTPKRTSLPLIFAVLLLLLPHSLSAQNAVSSSAELPDAPEPQNAPPSPVKPAPVPASEEVTLSGLPKRFILDQKAIWTSPLRLQPKDTIWLVPYATATGLLISSDQHTMNKAIHLNT